MDNEEIYIIACRAGDLATVILYDNINHDINKAFLWTCLYGQLEVAMYLLSKYDIDLHSQKTNPFKAACARGHANIVHFLKDKIKDQQLVEGGFILACINNHCQVIDYLLDYVEINRNLKKQIGSKLGPYKYKEILQFIDKSKLRRILAEDLNGIAVVKKTKI